MFCEKCGNQVPEGSKFCEACGHPTEVGIAEGAVAPEVSATPAAPSAFALWMKKFFSNKRNVIISVVALLLIIAAIVAVIIIASQPKKFYLDSCFTVEFSGTNGYGYVEIDWDEEKLEKLEKKLFTDKKYVGYLRYAIDIDIECPDGKENGELSNGDKITLVMEVNKEAKKYFNGILTLKNKTYKAKGLKEPIKFDLASVLNDADLFSGFNGYGTLNRYEDVYTGDIAKDISVTVNVEYSTIAYDFRFYGDNGDYSRTVYLEASKHEELSNNEEITFTVSTDDIDYLKESLAQSGIVFKSNEVKVNVSGLKDVTKINLDDKLKPVLNGYNGYGTITLDFDKTVYGTVGEYVLKLENKSGTSYRSFNLGIYDSDDDRVTYVTYSADNVKNLKNGDTVKFELSYDRVEDIKSSYGVEIPLSVSIPVSGLSEALSSEIASKISVAFSGYSGYGTFAVTIPEANQVYTVGDYTLKLSMETSYWYIYVTIVVADKNGNNVETIKYRVDIEDTLKNDDEIEFRFNSYSSDSEEYLKKYGIVFPETFKYKASGLTDTVKTNPLEFAKFSFAGTNGSITATASLTKTSYTVGSYTVELSISRSGFWGESYINFVVKDASGKECASGKYAFDDERLSEGDQLYVSYSFDSEDIVRKTGIEFNKEKLTVIVSTK